MTKWINSEPLSLKGRLRGQVVVIHFWTNGCSNCVNNYPHYRARQERDAGKDVAIIGIHTPETEGERDLARIKRQAEKNGLKFPIVVDNDGTNWRVWKNQVWPTVYVVDRQGVVRSPGGGAELQRPEGEETVRRDPRAARPGAPRTTPARKDGEAPSGREVAGDFTLESLAGGKVNLANAAEKGPVALVVLRGYPTNVPSAPPKWPS